jgi:hypothetical protein
VDHQARPVGTGPWARPQPVNDPLGERGIQWPDKNSKTCAKTSPKTGATFSFWHPDLTTMHVWIWYPNPAGLYSSTNDVVRDNDRGTVVT